MGGHVNTIGGATIGDASTSLVGCAADEHGHHRLVSVVRLQDLEGACMNFRELEVWSGGVNVAVAGTATWAPGILGGYWTTPASRATTVVLTRDWHTQDAARANGGRLSWPVRLLLTRLCYSIERMAIDGACEVPKSLVKIQVAMKFGPSTQTVGPPPQQKYHILLNCSSTAGLLIWSIID